MERRPAGSPEQLEARAAQLSFAADEVRHIASRMSSVTAAASRTGDNAAAAAARAFVSSERSILSNAATELEDGATHLRGLAAALRELQAKGDEILTRPCDAYLFTEAVREHQLHKLDEQAGRLRDKADAYFLQRARKTIRTTTFSDPPSFWTKAGWFVGGVGHDIADAPRQIFAGGGDIVHGFVAMGTGLWDISFRGIYDREGQLQHWRSTLATSEAIANAATHDPRGFTKSLVTGLIDAKTWKEEPFRAATVLVGEVLLAKGAGKLAKGARVAESARGLRAAEDLSETARGLRALDLPTNVNIFGVEKGKILELHPDGVWRYNKVVRGFDSEDIVADAWRELAPDTRHFVRNQKAVDIWQPTDGVLAQVKTIDPRLSSYQSPSVMKGVLHSYANKLTGVGTLDVLEAGGRSYVIDIDDVVVQQLVVGVPESGLSPSHLEVISGLGRDFPNLDIKVVTLP